MRKCVLAIGMAGIIGFQFVHITKAQDSSSERALYYPLNKRYGTVQIINRQTFHYRQIEQISVNPDGKTIITGGATAVKQFVITDTGLREIYHQRPFKSHHNLVRYFSGGKYYIVGSYGGFKIYNSASNSLRFAYYFSIPDNWASDAFVYGDHVLITDWHGRAYLYSIKNNRIKSSFGFEETETYIHFSKHVEDGLRALWGSELNLPYQLPNRGATKSFLIHTVNQEFIFPGGRWDYFTVWDMKFDTATKYIEYPNGYLTHFRYYNNDTTNQLCYTIDSAFYIMNLNTQITTKYSITGGTKLLSCFEFLPDGTWLFGTEERDDVLKPEIIRVKLD